MKHSVHDGLGPREVWLDGVLLERVVACDDDAALAIVTRYPYVVSNGELMVDALHGDTLVVRSIGNESQKV